MKKVARFLRVSARWARRVAIGALGIVALALVWTHATREARDDREWAAGFERTARVSFDGESVTVENFRNFRWSSPTEPADARWETRSFRLADLVAADLIVVPLGDWEGAAHTMLSFEFKSGDAAEHVTVSMEARREEGEAYSTWSGLFDRYELSYVFASEEDALPLRAVARGNRVHRYPLDVAPEHLRALFLNMATTAEEVAARPEFYGTLWNSCTTRFATHASIIGADVPLSWRYVLPGYSPALAYELGILEDGGVSFAELRELSRIDEEIRAAADAPNFSEAIRR